MYTDRCGTYIIKGRNEGHIAGTQSNTYLHIHSIPLLLSIKESPQKQRKKKRINHSVAYFLIKFNSLINMIVIQLDLKT